MKLHYDYVFVTHLPAFYKVNLYAEIAKHCRVFVIFIAEGALQRTQDFVGNLKDLDHVILQNGAFEKRNKIKSLYKLFTTLRQIEARMIVLGGWDLIECWALAFTTRKSKNALALESSIHESKQTAVAKLIKKLFLSRMGSVFASGEPHRALLKALNYKNKIYTTLGVGIFRTGKKSVLHRAFQGKFLFVGRLAPEKNIERLLDVFRHLPQFTLTLVGQGQLYEKLQQRCPSNVFLKGYVPNTELHQIYHAHDIFILPSLKEPWGLVVEEALYYGLPVIVSQRVGCAQDWIEEYQVGSVFDPVDNHAIEEAILWSASHYHVLCDQIKQIDFSKRDHRQVQQYLEALA
jgi:glycosyltransferase involved in cell wall biosynthesis